MAIDLEKVIQAIGGGAAGSWSLNNYGPRIAKGNFDPGFFIEHFIIEEICSVSRVFYQLDFYPPPIGKNNCRKSLSRKM